MSIAATTSGTLCQQDTVASNVLCNRRTEIVPRYIAVRGCPLANHGCHSHEYKLFLKSIFHDCRASCQYALRIWCRTLNHRGQVHIIDHDDDGEHGRLANVMPLRAITSASLHVCVQSQSLACCAILATRWHDAFECNTTLSSGHT